MYGTSNTLSFAPSTQMDFNKPSALAPFSITQTSSSDAVHSLWSEPSNQKEPFKEKLKPIVEKTKGFFHNLFNSSMPDQPVPNDNTVYFMIGALILVIYLFKKK